MYGSGPRAAACNQRLKALLGVARQTKEGNNNRFKPRLQLNALVPLTPDCCPARAAYSGHANIEQIRFVRGRPATSAPYVGTSLAILFPEDSDERILRVPHPMRVRA